MRKAKGQNAVPAIAHSIKNKEEAVRLNVSIRRTNRYQEYTCLHKKCTEEGFVIYPTIEFQHHEEI